MDAPTPLATTEPELEFIAKSIGDLDLLIRALLSSLPTSKPWQRQLRLLLLDADRLLQALRITISMEQSNAEILQAAQDLLAPLGAANVYVGAGRADAGTKQAIQLAFSLGQRAVTGLAEQRELSGS